LHFFIEISNFTGILTAGKIIPGTPCPFMLSSIGRIEDEGIKRWYKRGKKDQDQFYITFIEAIGFILK
jgi:hypothetical protein